MTSTETQSRLPERGFETIAARVARRVGETLLPPPATVETTRSQRIAILIHDLRGGGAERVAINLAKGMVEAGRQVDLVLISAQGVYVDQIPAGVRVVNLNKSNVFKAVPALVRYLRRERPRALLSSLTHVNIAALIAKAIAGGDTRIAVTEHNQISIKAAAPMRLRSWLVYRAVPYLYGLADDVVAVSQGAAADVARFARLGPLEVKCVYNPVYDEMLMQASCEPVDHPWLQPGRMPVLVAAGRLHRQKGFDVLLRAFATVRRTTPCKLIIMGEGEERGRLESLARELGIDQDVSLTGFVRNPYAMMSRAATFVVSSRWEGFSVVLLEALACGAPVVATDCASGPSEILDKGRYGILVPVDDVQALAEGILDTLKQQPGAGVERARGFSTEAATRAYLDILEAA